MSSRSRFVVPAAAALLLGAALAVRFLWPVPEAEPQTRQEAPVVKASSPVAPELAPVSPASTPTKPEPVKAEGPTEIVVDGRRATVVPIRPGDIVPEPEVANPPPQENDPIEPEKPQTAAWKHEKTVRISELLGRDVERLEQERLEAEKRGDGAEAKRLEVQLARHRARLAKMEEEKAALAEAARNEPAE